MKSIPKRDELERHAGVLRLLQILSILVVFVVGVVLGLAMSYHMNLSFVSRSEVYSFVNHISSSADTAVTTLNKVEEAAAAANCTVVVKDCERGPDCAAADALLGPRGNLTHRLSDDEVFWRASMVPQKKEYPFERTPRVAFMFLTRGALPLMPLWERFFEGHEGLFSIYVHASPGYKLNVSTASPFYGRQIPSQQVTWGTWTMAEAERRLLANALLNFSNERFVLLSESCIPIHNFTTVYSYLMGSNHSFVQSSDEPTRYGRGRYSRKMLPDITLHQWRKGSQWFELNRYLAVHIVSDTKYFELFKKFCLPACYPDEHYLPTYVNMFHGSVNSNRSVTWVDWSIGGPHPVTYEASNITVEFLQSLRNTGRVCQYNSAPTSICYLFARKFAPNSLEPLLKLLSSVIGF